MGEITSGFNRDQFEPGQGEAKVETIEITSISEDPQTHKKLVSAILRGPGIGECFVQIDIYPDGHTEFASRRMATNLLRAGSREEIGALIVQALGQNLEQG